MHVSLPSLQVMDYERYGRYETFCLVLCQHTVIHQSQKHGQSVHVCMCICGKGGWNVKLLFNDVIL